MDSLFKEGALRDQRVKPNQKHVVNVACLHQIQKCYMLQKEKNWHCRATRFLDSESSLYLALTRCISAYIHRAKGV